jgi:nucleoid DNA-binding protein
MEIHYEIKTLKNAAGEGTERKYVALHNYNPLTESEMESEIEESCSLTKADVSGMFTALRHIAVEQLSHGKRFHIPGIGWLSLAAGLNKDAKRPGHKITGKDIFLRAINFQPEEKFIGDVSCDMSFKQSGFSSKSKEYEEEALWAEVTDYLAHNDFITRRTMQEKFGLSKYKADLWLARFESLGHLRKEGNKHGFIYLPAK